MFNYTEGIDLGERLKVAVLCLPYSSNIPF